MKSRISLALALLIANPTFAQAPAQNQRDLSSMNIEQLMQVEVTSVSKKPERLSRAASAVFVITQDDIRRSGALNIPDLLRMVPGLDVAQVNGSSWAISARGFNDQSANKLLVLIDGRTVYSPLFSGVFWDAQEIPLETIERIEVIRGPGATVWGANAVNGVINIITKQASETQGVSISGGGGTYEHGFGYAQYGGKIGSNTYYRLFTNDFAAGTLLDPAGQSGKDSWDAYRIGFRADGKLSGKDSLTLEADGYDGNEGELVNTVTSISPPMNQTLALNESFGGWDVLTKWEHNGRSQTKLQFYFDRPSRGDPTYGEGRNTVDIDFQDHIGLGERQDVVWGAGYRRTSDDIRGSLRVSFNPPAKSNELFSAFGQDEIALAPDRLYLTVGVKLEHNGFSGFGVQPNARLAWILDDRNTLWAAVSRALKTPARDETVRFNAAALPGPGGLPVLVSLFGASELDESVLATEMGFRTELRSDLSFDVAAYYNTYEDLTSDEPSTPFLESSPGPLHLVAPFFARNLLDGESHGAEIALNWKLTSRWILSPGFAYEQIHIYRDPGSQDTAMTASMQGSTPREQAQLRSNVEINRHLEWNSSAYFVGRLATVPSYTRLDSGVTWQPAKAFSFSIVGQNLLRDHHAEFDNVAQIVNTSLIKRSAYAKFSLQF